MTDFSLADLAALEETLRDAARAEIMPRFRRLSAENVRTKSGPLDLVTDADEAAERMITVALLDRFPGCTVIGEEAAAEDPSLLRRVDGPGLVFVVDPVDGTANFAAGLTLFGTMAAAIVDGAVVAAAIHDPVGDDTALALRGQGAWTHMADGGRLPLRVTDPPVRVADMAGMVSWRYMPEPQRTEVCMRLPRVAGSWEYRCAAHSYRMLAAGHCHFALFNRLLPWDHAPGWLLHQEAGGYSARFDGSPYRPSEVAGGLICAPDEAGFLALRETLLG